MLKFSRNKMVTLHRTDSDTLSVHGVLADDIYGLEVDLEIRIPELVIVSATGKWRRSTTPDCHRAAPIVQTAEGFRIDADITPKLHKTIGRKSCRHFANLLVECCDAVKQAVQILQWEDARAERPDLTFRQFLQGRGRSPGAAETQASAAPPENAARDRSRPEPAHFDKPPRKRPESSRGSCIDLHVHTAPASPCSSAPVDRLIETAKAAGLDGICLTDHNHVWTLQDVEALRRKHGFTVLRGNEITTDQGDILVFGMDEDIQGIVSLETLRKKVLKSQGFMIAAHPFRGFLVFNAGDLGLTVGRAMDRKLFQHVDAVEVLNGKVTDRENRFAAKVTEAIGLPATGGSDAHEVDEVGRYATQFSVDIRNERDLVQALKSGRYSPIVFGEKMG